MVLLVCSAKFSDQELIEFRLFNWLCKVLLPLCGQIESSAFSLIIQFHFNLLNGSPNAYKHSLYGGK